MSEWIDVATLDHAELERVIERAQARLDSIFKEVNGLIYERDAVREQLLMAEAERERRMYGDTLRPEIDRCPHCGALIDPEAGPTCHCDPDA